MENIKVVSGKTEREAWPKIQSDLQGQDVLDYNILIKQGNKETELYIDIDLGGGFEGGWENTQLKAQLTRHQDFNFAVHDQDFIDTVGKFFGLQDVKTGYPALDKHLVVKTNDKEKVAKLFNDENLRHVLTELEDFDLGINLLEVEGSETKEPFLELNIDQGINDPVALRKIYKAFYALLIGIDGK